MKQSKILELPRTLEENRLQSFELELVGHWFYDFQFLNKNKCELCSKA